jgi:predicted ArsR family transcriptional regulator
VKWRPSIWENYHETSRYRRSLELAEALNLTDNAVRSHLLTLERDGLVRQSGKRTATRKPEVLYSLTSEAGQLFPKAYDLLFNQLLHSLKSRITPAEKGELLPDVGLRLAGVRAPLFTVLREAELRKRLKIAVDVLQDLGGLAELEDTGDEFVIRGFSCPLASVVIEHPEACQLAETLLAEIIGARAGGVYSQWRTAVSVQTEQIVSAGRIPQRPSFSEEI